MQARKVVQLGKSTLVVSLPKPWVDLHGLQPGKTVQVSMRGDGSLVIYPKEMKETERELTITFEESISGVEKASVSINSDMLPNAPLNNQ